MIQRTHQHPTREGSAPERRSIRSNQGRTREMVRYAGQTRWYRYLSVASVAWQRGDDHPEGRS